MYKCPDCPKSFCFRGNLTRHQRMAHEGKRFICENCFKLFGYQSNMKRHMRNCHLKKNSSDWEVITDDCLTQKSAKSENDHQNQLDITSDDSMAETEPDYESVKCSEDERYENPMTMKFEEMSLIKRNDEMFDYFCDECGAKFIKSTSKFVVLDANKCKMS